MRNIKDIKTVTDSPQVAVKALEREIAEREAARGVLEKLKEGVAQESFKKLTATMATNAVSLGALQNSYEQALDKHVRALVREEVSKRVADVSDLIGPARVPMTLAVQGAVYETLSSPAWKDCFDWRVPRDYWAGGANAEAGLLVKLCDEVVARARTNMLKMTDRCSQCGCMAFEGGETLLCKEHSLSMDRLIAQAG